MESFVKNAYLANNRGHRLWEVSRIKQRRKESFKVEEGTIWVETSSSGMEWPHWHLLQEKNIYEQCPYERALYIKKQEGNVMFIALYVDDLIFMGNKAEMIKEFKRVMEKEFQMIDLGDMKYFFGMEVKQLEIGYRSHKKCIGFIRIGG